MTLTRGYAPRRGAKKAAVNADHVAVNADHVENSWTKRRDQRIVADTNDRAGDLGVHWSKRAEERLLEYE